MDTVYVLLCVGWAAALSTGMQRPSIARAVTGTVSLVCLAAVMNMWGRS
ncbi:MAG: hypothetical protein HOY79_33910 [Streptomyces sp.]|nr:hypothetical protein [Streptomyces sp.]NUS11312.1 hypothetical protein [Streptomyces sp.]NUS23413.1 hypothetical protein [Streptomyces sp.]